MAHPETDALFIIGVDTHKHTHTASIVDTRGAELQAIELPADGKGYARMLTFARQHASGSRIWAIEGAGGYGRGLASHLIDGGERVIEIDRPKRPARRNGAKTDVLDATRAARECLARGETTELRGHGHREALRAILRTRERRGTSPYASVQSSPGLGHHRARDAASEAAESEIPTSRSALCEAENCCNSHGRAARHEHGASRDSPPDPKSQRRNQGTRRRTRTTRSRTRLYTPPGAGDRTGQRGRDGVRLVAPGTRALRSRIREPRRSRSDPRIVRPNGPPLPQPMRRPQAQSCDPQCRPRSLGPPPRDPTLCRTQARRREDRPRD